MQYVGVKSEIGLCFKKIGVLGYITTGMGMLLRIGSNVINILFSM